MADILRRLRDPDPDWKEDDIPELLEDAAREIEQLRQPRMCKCGRHPVVELDECAKCGLERHKVESHVSIPLPGDTQQH